MQKTIAVLMVTPIILSVVLAILAYKVLVKEEIVTILPPKMTHEATISMNTANSEYLMSFGLYVAGLTGNVTPKNVVLVADALGSLVDAKLYSEVRRQLFALANDPLFKERGGAVFFEPVNVVFDAPTGKVFVVGNMVSTTSAGRQNRSPLVYEIKIEMRNYRPVIVALDKYPGSVPRTLEWEKKNKQRLERQKHRQEAIEKPASPWFTDSIRYYADEVEGTPEQENGSSPEPEAAAAGTDDEKPGEM